MKIIYPDLVEESLRYHQGPEASTLGDKSKMYRLMIERGIILDNGDPTPEAIEKGWVKDFYEAENLSFDAFLKIYPLFKQYDVTSFELIDGFWEIPIEMKELLQKELLSSKFDYDESLQLTEYLAER